jgi:transposase
VTDGAGHVLTFGVTPGQMGDIRAAHGLLANLPPSDKPLADAACDSGGPRAFLLACGTEPVILNNPTRRRPHPFDRAACRACNAVERTIGRLKDWRRIHTRYDKLAANFASAIASAAVITCWC